ncbi:MAG: HDIG domain-containing protein [Methanocalculaceae archaeon]|jgi:putative nucleotidyltransferase with HDIG domain|nr:HDIG domain-containing protein [Methanocalculaceae archaeon]
MEKDEALALLHAHVKTDSLRGHCIATAAVMKGLAEELSEDARLWEVIGILHDIDFEEVDEDMTRHGLAGYDILKAAGVCDEIAEPIRRHNHMLFLGEYTTPVEICLQVADSVSGLVIACAYVKGGKVTEVTPKTVTKKYKTSSFAAGCDRTRIALGDVLVPRERMYEIAIREISAVRDQLGLA